MKKRLFNKLIIGICMILLCNSAAFCCWEEMTPVVTASGSFSGDNGYIFWNCSADSTYGLASIADAHISYLGSTSQFYNILHREVVSSRTIGYQWAGGNTPDPATFTLSWSGYVHGETDVIAETIGDYCEAQEYGYAKVLASDFDGTYQKWMVVSSQGAVCPADPPTNYEGRYSMSGTMGVQTGLPSVVSGEMAWNYLAMNRSEMRELGGQEASNTTNVNTSVSVFNHTGEGDYYNRLVDAVALQNSVIDLKFQCGDDEGYRVDAFTTNIVHTVTFSITQN